MPGFRYIKFFNFFGFGFADLGDPNNLGSKIIMNIGNRELGIYLAKQGETHVNRDKNTQSPTASA